LTGVTQIYAWNAGVLNYWLIITFYHKYFFAVLEVCLEVCMLTPTKEAIDAAMMYRREKLGLATLKPEQETAISIFTLGKDKITGSRCFESLLGIRQSRQSGISSVNETRM